MLSRLTTLKLSLNVAVAAVIIVSVQCTVTTERLKPKFHYANFPVTSATSPQQTRDVRGSFREVGIVEFGLYCALKLPTRRTDDLTNCLMLAGLSSRGLSSVDRYFLSRAQNCTTKAQLKEGSHLHRSLK